ncbi:MAG: geranylgeranylglycerol-phosphate geranylgeranyltransferase [Bacteroidales bacterium]|nr:geranylgeranylglycerol-phosphate geranylgeranyltransferase [Bacteroidales bacterium]MDT8372514.1 geranylgeranylglycerol-phosphate geranylgeranyltransferase [Bacteroidales bacterium]
MKHSRGEKIVDLMRLVRLPNLLVVALTMMLMRYAVIRPLLNAIPVTMADNPLLVTRMTFKLGWFDFLILVVSACFITAAGYVINDYFDIRTDFINRGRIIVGNTVTRRMAMMYHNVLNILGVAGGTYVSARIGYIWLGIFFVLITGLLYFYSAAFKKQSLIGNIIVALLVAMVPMLVVVYDAAPIYAFYSRALTDFPGVAILFWWVGGFSLFAFLTTLIREIIKDMEDCEGDRVTGMKTLPVSCGLKNCKTIVILLVLVTLLLFYLVWQRYLHDNVTLVYTSLLLAAPLLAVIYRVATGRDKQQFHVASRLMKLIMVAGMLYSLVAGAIITSGKTL